MQANCEALAHFSLPFSDNRHVPSFGNLDRVGYLQSQGVRWLSWVFNGGENWNSLLIHCYSLFLKRDLQILGRIRRF